MSPRPRKATDDEVFAAAYRAMNRLGPGELTLAEIAGEAGLTAGALVQRFGSKRGLLLSMAAQFAESAGDLIEGLRAQHASPLAAVRAYAECMSQLASSPAAFARSLAYLQIDLTDSEFRKHLVTQARATRSGLEKLIQAAIDAGELKGATDVGILARTVEAMVSGSMMTWAFYRKGSAKQWISEHVDAVLAPYVT
ncbi:MAG TPA: TetR/AcrR family transcriptional regulator [Gemmatimonadales bacterium]|nr:TetR/AcrR family transcriptional regulator [Gemmatimonadales bacterium]